MFVFLLTSLSFAVPLQFNHQGRLLDVDGEAVAGEHQLTFRIYDTSSGGTIQWEEVLPVNFIDGYYSVNLGDDEENNPLDTTILANYPLWIELTVDDDIMEPRYPMQSVPYSSIAGVAEGVEGGIVDADEIAINSNLVIDSDGKWVGQDIDWNDLSNIPPGISDGDDNWQLTEPEVEAFVTNNSIDLAAGSSVNGSAILTSTDTLEPDWNNIQGRPTGLDDGDDNTQLTEQEVEDYIVNDALELFEGTTVNGLSLVAIEQISCSDGDVLVWDGLVEGWFCEQDVLSHLSEDCSTGQLLKWNADDSLWECQNDIDTNTNLSSQDVIAFVEGANIQSTGTICDVNGCIGDSLWIQSGNDISFNGNVGIGTTSSVSLDVNGNIAATQISGTLLTSEQPNISEVGTISSGIWQGTEISDAYISNALTLDGSNIDDTIIGANIPQTGNFTDLSADKIEGTIHTAEQPNITSIGTLEDLDVTGDVTVESSLAVTGVIESTSGGIKFPDGTIQTSAADGEGYKSIWTYKNGTSHGDFSTSFVWGDWLNERLNH